MVCAVGKQGLVCIYACGFSFLLHKNNKLLFGRAFTRQMIEHIDIVLVKFCVLNCV
jgi:hypothetical protein